MISKLMVHRAAEQQKLVRKITTLRRLDAGSIFRVVESLVVLVSYRALVACLPYGFWKRKLLDAQAKPTFADFDIRMPIRFFGRFNIALKNLKLPTTCLQRSMSLQSMLRRRNVPAHVLIGVARNQRFPECHAWVEANGRILFEDPRISSEYLPFLTDKSNKTDP